MLRRARSLSRLRGTTPGRETTPSIYDYGSGNDGLNGGGFSTRLNVYTPDVYGSISRSARAVSVARSKDVDDEIFGGVTGGSYNRYHRGQSIGRFDHLKARRPYSAYGTHDFDYFDRYTERIRDKTPIALDSHYAHYRPYYWYHTAPRTFYYSFPYDDWRYRPLSNVRASSNYSWGPNGSPYNYRFNDSIDRITSLKRAMRDLDYTRELRQLRYSTPSTYSTITHGDHLLSRARDDVRRTIDSRVGSGSSGLSRLSNPRDYFGRTYVQFEKDGVTDVGVKYNGLSKVVDFKPSTWKAEDNLETGYDLQAMNDDTIEKIYANQNDAERNQRRLLQDKAGVAPRTFHFSVYTNQTRRKVDNALRLVENLKEMKNKIFNRLSQPWTFGSYLSP